MFRPQGDPPRACGPRRHSSGSPLGKIGTYLALRRRQRDCGLGRAKSSDEGCTAYSGLQCPVRDVRACRGPIDEQHVRTKSACTHTSTWQERLALRRMWWKSVSRAGRVSDAVYGRPDRRPANGGPAASEGDCRRTAGSLATLVRRAVWRPTGLPATVAAIHPQAVLPQHQATSDVRGDVPRTRPA